MIKMKIIVITPNADEDTENMDNSYIASGNVECQSYSGKIV